MRQHNKYHRNLKRIMEEMDSGSSVKKRSKGSSSSIQKSKLITTSEHNLFPDLISALPDSLLLHILSFLGMEQVMKTSLLSRRWRYLWKSIPCLCFDDSFSLCEMYPNFIDRCLFHHEGYKIRMFRIRILYKDTLQTLVDSWIHFATRRKVEEFELGLYYPYEPYKLPRTLYFCGTLTSLSLSMCDLNLPDSFQLGSLRMLDLFHVELNPDSIEHLSSSCPVLEDIHLADCNNKTDLNIVITNHHVKMLEIQKYEKWKFGTVKINAPTLLSLGIYNFTPDVSTVRFHVEELGSLMSVDIIGPQEDENCREVADFGRNLLGELLYDLRHVKQLKLTGWCLQLLSLTKLQSVELLSISATCLKLQTNLTKWELPGVIYLLQSCSNLEKLKIETEDPFDEVKYTDEYIEKQDFEEKEFWESFETDITSIMQKLKIIEINLEHHSRPAEFVSFLLKNAKVLEKMVIKTPKQEHRKYNLEQQFKLSQRLHAFPRLSPNAKLFIT